MKHPEVELIHPQSIGFIDTIDINFLQFRQKVHYDNENLFFTDVPRYSYCYRAFDAYSYRQLNKVNNIITNMHTGMVLNTPVYINNYFNELEINDDKNQRLADKIGLYNDMSGYFATFGLKIPFHDDNQRFRCYRKLIARIYDRIKYPKYPEHMDIRDDYIIDNETVLKLNCLDRIHHTIKNKKQNIIRIYLILYGIADL